MSGDPFDPRGRTVIRPIPGGRRAGVPPTPPSDDRLSGWTAPPRSGDRAPPPPREMPASDAPISAVIAAAGQPPLLSAAAPLLHLLGNLRSLERTPDPAALRGRTVAAIRRFDADARSAGVAPETVHQARYVLCASIDDVVLNTQWGEHSPWLQDSLVADFHKEVISGENLFYLLERLQRDARQNRDLLALMFICISLGYQGQYRLLARGQSDLETIRQNLYAALQRATPAYEPELSPRWRGEAAPYRPGYTPMPLWVIVSAAVLLLSLAWGTAWWWLGTRADAGVDLAALEPRALPVVGRIPEPAVRPAEPLPSPPPPEERLPSSLNFLQPRIDAGNVSVSHPPGGLQLSLLDLGPAGLFESGSADLRPGLADLLRRIGEALNGEPGQVLVAGHTDNQPIAAWNLRFRSNLDLSVARAEAAAAVLRGVMRDPSRITTQGFGAQYPLKGNTNATPEERSRNRRIEISLRRPAEGDSDPCTDCSRRCTAAGC